MWPYRVLDVDSYELSHEVKSVGGDKVTTRTGVGCGSLHGSI